MHSFPTNTTTYKDTYNRGKIVIRGFTLIVDEEGFVEGPADIAKDLQPHGFIPMPRPAKPQAKK